MCGRFTLTSSARDLAERFELAEPAALAPRYNIAPGQDVAVVRAPEPNARRVLELRRWGLVPAWAKDPRIGHRTINARAESLAEKAAFRSAFRCRRCLIPADGFYEWQRRGPRVQPWYMRFADGPLGLAGLYERWRGPDGEILDSCTIITTGSNARVRELHSRMPAILEPPAYARWLDPRPRDPARLRPLLRPCPPEWLVAIPVGRRVNDVENDDAACIAPVRDLEPQFQQVLF